MGRPESGIVQRVIIQQKEDCMAVLCGTKRMATVPHRIWRASGLITAVQQ